MNYNYLRYFSVLAQVEHYTIAAARLGISQPSLSSAIHSLENALGGIRLFEKVGRNIRLTEEGKLVWRGFQNEWDDSVQPPEMLPNRETQGEVEIQKLMTEDSNHGT